MDIFSQFFDSADYLFSFFYRFIICDYKDFLNFFKGNYTFNITSLVNAYEFSVTLPNIPILDTALDLVVDLVGSLFKPLPFLYDPIGYQYTPFYNCLISFFINSLIIVASVKLVAFIIELVPGE